MNQKADPYVRLLLSVLFISLLLLSLVRIHDSDSWLHLSHGKMIWSLKDMPSGDVFVYANDGPYVYTSWLFGVVCYLVTLAMGGMGLNLLKSSVIILAFWLLYNDARRQGADPTVTVIVLLFAALYVRYRFVLRPDILLILYLSATVYCLNAYVLGRREYLFALPLMFVLWANTHSSFPVMAVPFLAFLGSGAAHRVFRFERAYYLSPDTKQMKVILTIFVISLLATLLNPNLFSQFTYGFDLLSSGWYKNNITELRYPQGAFLISICVLIGVIMLSFVLNRKNFSLVQFLLVLPFMILPLTAVRFMFLPAVVGTPILARNMSGYLAGTRLGGHLKRPAAALVAGALVMSLSLLTVLQVRPFGKSSLPFGMGFDTAMMPAGAVEYMDRNGIRGRVFNSARFGQYVIWTGYPGRTVYMDGRFGLPVDLLERSNSFRYSPEVLDDLYSRFGFESILVRYTLREDDSVKDVFFSHPGWALMYWDDVSLLYVRKGGVYEPLIERDGYVAINPDMSLPTLLNSIGPHLKDHSFTGRITDELERNITETGSARARVLLGFLYNALGMYDKAVIVLNKIEHNCPEEFKYLKHKGLGFAYAGSGQREKGLSHYKKAKYFYDDEKINYLIGHAYFQAGQYRKAVRYLKISLKKDPGHVTVYPLLVSAYNKLGMSKQALDAQRDYESLLREAHDR